MEREELIEDPRFRHYYDRMANYFALRPIVEEEFLKRTRDEWEARLIAEDVPFAPVLSMTDIATHPQTDWLQLLEPERDGKVLVRPPWRFWGERPDRPFRAPHLGEHSREVALEVRDAEEVDRLVRAGVIVQAPEEAPAEHAVAGGE
jgi:crotonobetainyl-CoA:carnitine CoA-transferase CaiB-like acyl-CoA transferase